MQEQLYQWEKFTTRPECDLQEASMSSNSLQTNSSVILSTVHMDFNSLWLRGQPGSTKTSPS
jgi:hypothetical protein